MDREERKPLLGINSCNNKGETALHISCAKGHVEVAELLLDAGAKVNLTTKDEGQTPLHLACLNDQLRVVKLLLNCGNCDINAKDHFGDTPLHLMVRLGNSRIAEVLVRHGANTRSRNHHAVTPLEEAKNRMSINDDLFLSLKSSNIIEVLEGNANESSSQNKVKKE